MEKKASDFRYNTGETKVPWAAVGENYNAQDLMTIIRFMMKGKGEAYDEALKTVEKDVLALDKVSAPPAKLSLDVEVGKAENMCDEYLHTTGSTFLTNCTAGFEIACKYTGLKPGDEVIVPAITFAATMAYPLSIGCKLVFEDAAHAFGGEYKHRKLGTIGDFGSFSFHEVKNITSFGEGGILCSNVTEFLPEMRRARFLGTDFSKHIPNWLYDVTAIRGKNGPFVATNFSTTEIQGLGLQLQIARIDQIIEARRRASEYLTKRLSACDALIPQDLGNDEIKPTFHLYQLQIIPEKAGGDIQLFKKKMDAKGVTQIPHFGPLYKFEILREYGYDEKAIAESCPVCEEVFNHRFTHFPVYGLTPEQLDYMADAILESVDEMQRGV